MKTGDILTCKKKCDSDMEVFFDIQVGSEWVFINRGGYLNLLYLRVRKIINYRPILLSEMVSLKIIL